MKLTRQQRRAQARAMDRDWNAVAWTPFVPGSVEDHPEPRPLFVAVNSRYQVFGYPGEAPAPFGRYVHLSIKTHDRQARHDWRDMQRIKNELCGEEAEAVELFPAESRMVDTSNQYHLFVFRGFRFPFGWNERLIADGSWRKSRQREFEAGARPGDCLDPAQYQEQLDAQIAAGGPLRSLKQS